jgi:hypothetical protein
MRPGAHVFQIFRTSPGGQLRWRLVSPNGRAVGCGVESADSLTEATASITSIVAAADDLVPTLRLAADRRWEWTLFLEGLPVVRGAVSHDRHVRCEMAWKRFVLAAPLAELDDEVHQFRGASRAPRTGALS